MASFWQRFFLVRRISQRPSSVGSFLLLGMGVPQVWNRIVTGIGLVGLIDDTSVLMTFLVEQFWIVVLISGAWWAYRSLFRISGKKYTASEAKEYLMGDTRPVSDHAGAIELAFTNAAYFLLDKALQDGSIKGFAYDNETGTTTELDHAYWKNASLGSEFFTKENPEGLTSIRSIGGIRPEIKRVVFLEDEVKRKFYKGQAQDRAAEMYPRKD